jgi:hypothetical protein
MSAFKSIQTFSALALAMKCLNLTRWRNFKEEQRLPSFDYRVRIILVFAQVPQLLAIPLSDRRNPLLITDLIGGRSALFTAISGMDEWRRERLPDANTAGAGI